MKVRALGAIAFATLLAAVAHADNVVAATDSAAPFSTYNTYAWTAGTTSPDVVTERRIHAAVEAQFSGKVIRLAAPDETPDIYVATHVLGREQKDFAASGPGSQAVAGSTIDAKSYKPGTLVVDVYDAKTKKVVWRGVAVGIGSDKPSPNADRIDNALAAMFKRYPSMSN
jgi:Domain of unknown function (DUF4136)